ncbi:DMT family transporter [Marinivivus vitaminiproducens]|uniref:DMT family transporter n=1 Tax=Marinivivus vitaminiproducens TaxID=3035935 RepID=UPI00279AA2BD|nr:DMT family transporter [Geminicoccaceae bacterium SCSIO 64248]
MSGAETSTVAGAIDATLGDSRKRLAGLFWASLAVSIFAGWFVITRFSVTRELSVWDITALRFGIGAVLLAPVLLRRRTTLPLVSWGEGLLFALFWGVPFVLLVALGLSLTSAAQAASTTPTLMPLFAGIFAWGFLGERQGAQRWAGYTAIFAGLSLLVLVGAAHGPPSPAGLGALAAAAAMWAVYTLLFRKSGLAPIESAALICVWSAALFLPAYVLLGLSRISHASAAEIALQALYQGVLMSGVAIFTFNRAVSLLGSSAATAIIALIPAVASLLAVPVLGEVPSAMEGAAIAVIVAGVLLASRRPGMAE